MARYEHLPIYKATYDLLLAAMQGTKSFPREYKYTLGQNIKDEIVGLVVFIYRANSTRDRADHIDAILERIQVISVLIRLCHDMKIMQRKHYARLVELTQRLGQQAQGWKRSSGKTVPEQDVSS
ncbi:four helix bundle protein [bacterium]|nr:four helix bundle protein [bacterium]